MSKYSFKVLNNYLDQAGFPSGKEFHEYIALKNHGIFFLILLAQGKYAAHI